MTVVSLGACLRRLCLALPVPVPLAAAAVPQETCATLEAAITALMAALKADSGTAARTIVGEEHVGLILR